ncbi:alpha-D-ribose 1-methylphosphonate 5-triphosphate diphosphatase [Promicromonospora umidemergens]|uniref:alpha-D-ribose 1-methylphosphonate 5-triphosphate diphosphatase n=1 Tax=Promicromonospora umidemergens TaxID=629679 RepID=UPI0020A28887|nr:alpha-D-ribose 1-methylphosphonate 5-triphosphate diphosphatase [Promicromonospora umidemergens]
MNHAVAVNHASSTPRAAPAGGWPLGETPGDWTLGGVTAVLPDRVVDDAWVVVRGGRIVEVGARPPGARPDLDGRGALCLPGLVDVHTDVLAHERKPRPGADLPLDLAVRTATERLAGCGVLTAFHGVPFGAHTPVGLPAGLPGPEDLLHALQAPEARASGARVLYRLDIRSPAALPELEAALAHTSPRDIPPLVSHEDHTPGIGQYADPAAMERLLVGREGFSADDARAHVRSWRQEREDRSNVAAATLTRLGDLAHAGRIRLAGHDPESAGDIEALVARGGVVAEFPTTVEAARAARADGLAIVAGAPNAVRGGSHTANVSARELVALGLVDALASDYVPATLLAVIEVLVREGLADLPRAVALVTSGPARAAGLTDRGSLVPGARADVVLVRTAGRWPSVVATLRATQDQPREEEPGRC